MTKRQIVLLAGDKMPDGYKSCGYKNCFEEQCKGNCTFPEPISPMKETEQTLLDQIKDQVAREFGYSAYRDFINGMDDSEMIDEIAERYATAKAKASCEATLKNASEKATVRLPRYDEEDPEVNKSSILDPSNIVIVSPVNQNSNGETRF